MSTHFSDKIYTQQSLGVDFVLPVFKNLRIALQHGKGKNIQTDSGLDFPPHDCKDEEGLTYQHVCNQTNSSLDQEDPSQIKEGHEELSTTEEGKPLEQKQETETFPASEESDYREPEPSSVLPLSHNSPVTDQCESKDNDLHRNNLNPIIADPMIKNSKKTMQSVCSGAPLEKNCKLVKLVQGTISIEKNGHSKFESFFKRAMA
ncbi:hypothetical protein Ciccas_007510 [Cichlidogyrus casuarinus]|uniref:Uncharacterized protein n=1 Tax=Cichlidogyrus casuarinus TaxID=1844966 RepID=A0ABD2Q3U3_9PLAT